MYKQILDVGLDMNFLSKKIIDIIIKEIIHKLYYKILNLKYLNRTKSQKLCQKFNSLNI